MVGGRFRVIGGRFGMIWGWFGVVWGWFWVVRGRFGMVWSWFGCVIDRFLRFVCRCWVVVRFLLGIVRGSLIGDLGHISVVMVSSVRHMLRPPIRKSNGVRTCRVCTQLGRFITCHDCEIIETKKRLQVASI